MTNFIFLEALIETYYLRTNKFLRKLTKPRIIVKTFRLKDTSFVQHMVLSN